MADALPICDVLIEAMEYLTKLGTNIRIRSENLKEKRIRKDKLRNTHAIHKAVAKVLLICELSKKSIANVETGVKNLLLQMEKAGSTFGPGPLTRKSDESDVNYEYFTYESRRLKIRDKISIDHYTSVKVVSTSMALSMIENYPVYHDCKLYRIRKKKKKREINASVSEHDHLEIQDLDKKEKSGVDTKDISSSKSEYNNMESIEVSDLSHNEEVESQLEITKEMDNDRVKSEDVVESHDKFSKNKVKQSTVVKESCSEGDKNESSGETKPKKKKYNNKAKKFKHIKLMDDSSSSDTENCKDTVEETKQDEKVEKNKQCEKESPRNLDLNINLNTEQPCLETKENQADAKTSIPSETKSLIKCVSLSKLLKPDIAKNLGIKNTEVSKQNTKKGSNKPCKESEARNNKKLKSSDDTENESAYWYLKREEVKNFKPKEFNINLSRLPKITHTFLNTCNIKRITQMGSVICEVFSDIDNGKSEDKEKNDSEPKSKRMKVIDRFGDKNPLDLNKIKSALLDDSDSDSVETCQGNKEKLQKLANNELIPSNDSDLITITNEKESDKVNDSNCETTNGASKSSVNDAQCANDAATCNEVDMQKTDHDGSEEVENNEPDTKMVSEKKKLDEDPQCERNHDNKGKKKSNTELESSNVKDKKAKKFCSQKSDFKLKFKMSHSQKPNENKEKNAVLKKSDVELQKIDTKDQGGTKKNITPLPDDSVNTDMVKMALLLETDCDTDQENTDCNCNKEINSQDGVKEAEDNFPTCKHKASSSEDNETMKTRLMHDSSDDISQTPKKLNSHSADCDIDQEITGGDSNKELNTQDGVKEAEDNFSTCENTICNTKDNGTVKSSLLQDSSVDISQTPKKRYRHSGECDTDYENTNGNSNREINTQDVFKEAEENFSNIVCCSKDNEIVKSSLLQDSSDDISQTPKKLNSHSGDCDTDQEYPDCNSITDINSEHSVKEAEDEQLTSKPKISSSKDTEIVKSSLLQDSSDDISKTPKKRKSHSEDSPPQSKRKHIMESMYAKKMLLTYSSSSDTEDEQLRSALKEIKDHLLKCMSSDVEDKVDMRDSLEKGDENVNNTVSKGNSPATGASESEKEFIKTKTTEADQANSDTKDTSNKGPTCGSMSDNSNESKVGPSSATPDACCSQKYDIDNEDAHDKEIDGLTNLKTLLKTHRRRKSSSSSTDHNDSTTSRRRRRMAKASGLISNEGFLEAESSSDAVSLSGSDHADNVDLDDVPRLNLTDINGDDIGHLAKDDLLVESDTSISPDEKKFVKKEEDTDDDNVKSTRRKMVTISSDSEVGSSRRKNNLRLSESDESDDDNSEPVKNKRKKKVIDSDASGGSSSDGKKKRRRIKTLDDSDGSGSDTGNEGRNKHGRKNIRKVMGKNQLEEATKKAAREEKERIARIAERQKVYNNLEFDESGKPDEVVLEKVVLDFDPETKEPLIQVDRGLVKKLKPHQANGIKFMWDACFESVKRIKKDKGSGCILAHCMGLGKTLQVVSLTHTLLTHGSLTGVNRVLVVCPLSTVLNWVNEFNMWLKHADSDYEVDVYELSKFKQNSERAFQLSQWFQHGGVCVLGYEMFRNLSADKGKKFKKKILKNFQESLVDPGPDLVVCDEGHLLKNEKTSLSQSMNRVKTRRRIVLTGTPLQNNLKEYYCMVQFVKPNLLGKYNEYLNRFVNPITNGQYTDSTEHDIRVMKRRSHVLHKMLDGAVQRRDYGVLAPFLPPKHEYVLFITLTDVQIKLYHHYLDNYSRRPQPGKSSGFLFPDFQSLQRIWTHPMVLKYNSERYEIMQQKKREREEDSEGSLIDFIDDDSTPESSSTEDSSEDSSDLSDDSRKKSKKKKSGKKGKGKDSKASTRRGTRANPIEIDDDEPIETLEVKNENPTEWWMKLVNEEELEDMRNSHKLILLFDILRQCEAIGDKLLVFSQSLYSLDLIEYFLGKVDEATQAGRIDEKLGGHVGSWSPGIDYFRLDGSSSCENRSIWCKNFNKTDNQRARLFLISTRAGGLGINLVAANRVVIFDVSWNPSHDVQSIFRVYRFGQKKPCYVYRFLAMGTMEEKIYERQVTKQAISKRVIDEQQIDRHYAENDLAELYKFEPQPPVPRPLPPLPKDRLFAEMLKEHEAQIYKYHEHDSLLENKEEETLSEEERRAAWEDFENEKTRPPPQPFLSPYAMHNGMVQGLIAQQQQMAMAAISAMLRKNAPNMSEKQIRETVPLLLASNPGMFGGYDYGLIPNMSEMYKYPQPGMMNHPMMNPMTTGAGGDMSGGSGMGASALHYEPPWQRQQQQQQQMRLQQLMQHQNSMGAKYYAGGLGSRDPMAMALQQQRARELMHRPRSRGRPPQASAAPRPPPAGAGDSAGDVVNLDSD